MISVTVLGFKIQQKDRLISPKFIKLLHTIACVAANNDPLAAIRHVRADGVARARGQSGSPRESCSARH